jgi:hypothetical protein
VKKIFARWLKKQTQAIPDLICPFISMRTRMGKSYRRWSLSQIGINGRGSDESLPPPIYRVAFPILVLRQRAHEGFIESLKKRENSRTGNFPKAGLKRFGIGVKQYEFN